MELLNVEKAMKEKNSHKKRCDWLNDDPLYIKYHDEEWGNPVFDDKIFFEFLILEQAQAGLSFLTILKRRENYRKSFANFNFIKVSNFNDNDILRLIQEGGIIRNKKKIVAAINNSKRFIEIRKEFGSFCRYFWGFVGGKQIINSWQSFYEIPPYNDISLKISKDMKKRGFTFIGPTIIYSMMQATGLVWDHTVSCFRYNEYKNFKIDPLNNCNFNAT